MATTADEVWALLGQLIESQKESRQEAERQMQESRQETERQMQKSRQETERQMQKSRQEAERSRQEAERQMQESRQETERSRQEVDRELKALSKQTQELGKQIGGLGKKFGSFTEGLALPSMERILEKQFGMEIISPSVRARKAGQHLEIDVLAYAHDEVFELETPQRLSAERMVKSMEIAPPPVSLTRQIAPNTCDRKASILIIYLFKTLWH